MTSMLFNLVDRVCGRHARELVIEPLVADWQNEMAEARDRGHWRLACAMVLGSAAFTRSLVRCAMARGGWLPAWRASGIGILAFVAATATAAAGVALIAVQSGRPLEPGLRTYSWLLGTAALYVPPAMLPALFLLRRDLRTTTRHAVAAIALGAALTTAIIFATSPDALNRYFSSFEWAEREYQRGLANDQAGRYQYPATAYRQLDTPKTIDERRDRYARFMVWLEQQRSKDLPPSWRDLLNRLQPAFLAILFGGMGWTLAGMGSPSIARAMLWWALVYVMMLGFGGGLLASAIGGISLWNTRIPYWIAIPVITAITGSLVFASRRLAPQALQAPPPY